MSRVLRLPIKKQWFEQILEGVKKEEYREIKPFYVSRLVIFDNDMIEQDINDFCNEFFLYSDDSPKFMTPNQVMKYYGAKYRIYDKVELINGYGKSVPRTIVDCRGIEIKRGNKEWGASDNFCFSIKLASYQAACNAT